MMKFKKSLKRYGAVPCATGLATVAMAFRLLLQKQVRVLLLLYCLV